MIESSLPGAIDLGHKSRPQRFPITSASVSIWAKEYSVGYKWHDKTQMEAIYNRQGWHQCPAKQFG
jgi:hypothetical protein